MDQHQSDAIKEVIEWGAARVPSRARRPDYPMASQSPIQDAPQPPGLTSDEARRRLERFGPNTIPDTALHPLRSALAKFWAPVPWMLETAGVLELVLGKYVEASVIAGLLAVNAALGFRPGRTHPRWEAQVDCSGKLAGIPFGLASVAGPCTSGKRAELEGAPVRNSGPLRLVRRRGSAGRNASNARRRSGR